MSLLPSAGRRFSRAFAVALIWSLVIGGILALLTLARPPPTDAEGDGTLAARLPRWLETWELRTFDWRARSLGRISQPTERVVLVPVDAETLAQARASPHDDVAVRPWPRDLLARLMLRLGAEGATAIVVDALMPDASQRQGPGGEPSADLKLKRALEATPAATVLGFSWASAPPLAVGVPLRPYGLRISGHPSDAAARGDLARVLAQRRPPYLIPASDQAEVWAGVEDDVDARALSEKLSLPAPMVFRELTAAERSRQVDAQHLLAEFAEVHVDGLEVSRVSSVRSLAPPVASLLGGRGGLGALTLVPDADGRVRSVPLLVNWSREEGDVHLIPSAVLTAAMEISGERHLRYAQGRLYLGDKLSMPMEPTGHAYLAWDSAEGGTEGQGALARSVSAWRIVTNLLDAEVGLPAHYRNDLQGRVTVFTDAVEGALPRFDTPIGGGVIRGAVLGQGIANLLESRGVHRVSTRVDAWVTLALAVLGGLTALLLKNWVRTTSGALAYIGVAAAMAGLYAAFAHGAFIARLQWIALFSPVAALGLSFAASAAYALRADSEARELISSALGRYIRPDIERRVLRDVALMRPERREVSVAHMDIEGFGAMSRRLPPEKLAALLNEILTELTALAREQGGQVEYAGDAMRAFWGAPVPQPDHAERACEFALASLTAVARRSKEWKDRYKENVALRIGVATGEVLAGDFGSSLKSHYTVMGEAVALAARLERANVIFHSRVLASERAAGGAGRRFALRELDRIQYGEEAPHRVFELLADRKTFGREEWERLGQYERALALFRARCFSEALPLFEASAAKGDAVAQVYAKRAAALLQTPPTADWDTVGDLHRVGERKAHAPPAEFPS
ncbi:MAG: CHASE2 domain-containing protein [Myxococcaceae bacterium]